MEPARAFFREAGRGAAVVCVHSSASSSAQWRPLPMAALDGSPGLYITGSESPASSRAVARLLTKVLPRVTAGEIEGVEYMAPVTHPDRINALIEDHLEERVPRVT